MEKSSIKLLSNIMLKSRISGSKDKELNYLPVDLLPREYSDVRNDLLLSNYQRTQKIKRLFLAERIVDDLDNE